MFAAGLTLSAEVQAVGETTRVSVDSTGIQGKLLSVYSSLSADGRFVAFNSDAGNLVPNDTNRSIDVFVHDRQTRQTTRVSVASTGEEGRVKGSRNYYSSTAFSADGRFVAYGSLFTNLVPGDTNGTSDVFVHDRLTGITTRVSVDSLGEQGNNFSSGVSISADGRFVAFGSYSDNLVAGDTNGMADVFVHDRLTGITTRVSITSAGLQAQAASGGPALSADGRYVGFMSYAADLAPGDGIGRSFVYVHDRQTHETTRITHYSTTGVADSQSFSPSISADGRFIAFASDYRFFVPGDTNEHFDVFVHDRKSGQTSRVNVASDGSQADAGSISYSLSGDGRYIAFASAASNLAPGDMGIWGSDIYVHDRLNRQTTRITRGSSRLGYGAFYPQISANGRFVAFESNDNTELPGDKNGPTADILVRDRLLDRSVTADLAVTQAVSPSPFPASSPITYTVTVTNHGPDAASDVTLVDGPLQATAVASQGTCSAGAPKVCYLGTLAAGAEATVTLTLRPRSAGTTRIWNSARVDAAPVDPNPGNNKTGLHVSAAP